MESWSSWFGEAIVPGSTFHYGLGSPRWKPLLSLSHLLLLLQQKAPVDSLLKVSHVKPGFLRTAFQCC